MTKTVLKLGWIWMIAVGLVSATAYSEPAFTTDVKSGPYPWTHTRFIDASDDFHFAVVSDRNGGCRPGVFELAVKKLNLLRPSLVMSVGDYIPGYTANADLLRDQWVEFDGIIKELEPPFFFVPGNHDYCNFGSPQPVLDATEKLWRSLRGPTHYWFVYKNTLFVCLNSMGGENHHWGLGEEQFNWARDVLAAHPDVRWTFVFMHNPLWLGATEGGFEKSLRFPELEKILAGRKHTVFAGHWHEYARYDRHGMKYFILSTTGGCSELAGSQWGEFDHIMWVSMSDSGPRFSNLALEGILDDDVCTAATVDFKRSVRLVSNGVVDKEKGADLAFSFKNTFDKPLRVTMAWKNEAMYSIQPKEITETVEPGAAYSKSFHVDIDGEAGLALPKLSCRFTTDRLHVNQDYTPPASCFRSLWVDKTGRTAFRAAQAPKIDGKLDDPAWQRAATVDGFMLSDVSGAATPKTQTWFAYDDKNLYVAWRCTENDMKGLVAKVGKRDGEVWHDDSIELFLDTKLDYTTYVQFIINPLGTVYDGMVLDREALNSRALAATSCGQDCWTVELVVPWEDLKVQPPQAGAKMGYELARARPRAGAGQESLSQFPPLGTPFNHQPKLFGVLVFEK